MLRDALLSHVEQLGVDELTCLPSTIGSDRSEPSWRAYSLRRSWRFLSRCIVPHVSRLAKLLRVLRLNLLLLLLLRLHVGEMLLEQVDTVRLCSSRS